MYKVSASFKLSCILERLDRSISLKLCLSNKKNKIVNVLEFADITSVMEELILVNEELNIYNDIKDLEKDIVKGALQRFTGRAKKNKKLDFILKVHAKALHEHKACRSYCVYCNPDLTQKDFFPDFTFDARHSEDTVEL